MKTFFAITMALVLTLSLAGCTKKDDSQNTSAPSTSASQPSTQPSTQATTPSMDPTMGTNIPDPSVDTSMPEASDGSGATSSMG